MKYTYTAIFKPAPSEETKGKVIYGVSFPDLPCHTCGNDLTHAIEMAQDALCLCLYHREQEGKEIPNPTEPQNVKVHKDEFISAISVDTTDYKRFYSNQAVKKTLTIPAWLNTEAEKAHINFSGILQAALKEKLQLSVHSKQHDKKNDNQSILVSSQENGTITNGGDHV